MPSPRSYAGILSALGLILAGALLARTSAQPMPMGMMGLSMMGGGGGGAMVASGNFLYVFSGGTLYKIEADSLKVATQAVIVKQPGPPEKPQK